MSYLLHMAKVAEESFSAKLETKQRPASGISRDSSGNYNIGAPYTPHSTDSVIRASRSLVAKSGITKNKKYLTSAEGYPVDSGIFGGMDYGTAAIADASSAELDAKHNLLGWGHRLRHD